MTPERHEDAPTRGEPEPTEERAEPVVEAVERGRWWATPFVLVGGVATVIWLVAAAIAGVALVAWWLA